MRWKVPSRHLRIPFLPRCWEPWLQECHWPIMERFEAQTPWTPQIPGHADGSVEKQCSYYSSRWFSTDCLSYTALQSSPIHLFLQVWSPPVSLFGHSNEYILQISKMHSTIHFDFGWEAVSFCCFFVVVYFVALGKNGLLLPLAVFWDSKMWGGEEAKECGSGSWISILWSTMHISSSDLKDPCPMANGVVEERAYLRSSLPCLWRILQDF